MSNAAQIQQQIRNLKAQLSNTVIKELLQALDVAAKMEEVFAADEIAKLVEFTDYVLTLETKYKSDTPVEEVAIDAADSNGRKKREVSAETRAKMKAAWEARKAKEQEPAAEQA